MSLTLRFRKGGKELDNKARLDLDRVVSFIADLKYTGQNILLFGFADDGVESEINLDLSKQRAELVAEQFKRRGLTPTVVTGFGATIPVASSLTEEGKEKNRSRVVVEEVAVNRRSVHYQLMALKAVIYSLT